MTELFVSFKPSPEGPAFLVTADAGTHELTRVFFYDGHFSCGWGNDRVGQMTVVRADYTPGRGLTVRGVDRMLFVPESVIQTVNWR